MIGNFAVAGDVFQTGKLVGKNGGQQIFRFHALQRRGNFSAAALARQGERARRVPAPANRKHRRIQQRLDQEFRGRSCCSSNETLRRAETNAACRAKARWRRRWRRLQFKIERAAKTFAQRQSPGAIQPRAERRMNDQLHPAGFVEESFHHEFLLRRNDAQRLKRCAEIIGQLGCAGIGNDQFRP